MADYSYTKTPVNLLQLESEIKASSVIVSALDYVYFLAPDDLKITFSVDLTTTEQTELTSIVVTHSAQNIDAPASSTSDEEGAIAFAIALG